MATLPNGKLLAAGGLNVYGVGINSAEIFDPSTGSWSYTAPMNSTRQGFGLVALGDGRILAAGNGSGSNTSAELYDPTSASWQYTGNMVTDGPFASYTALSNSPTQTKVLRAGGTSSTEIYDSSTGNWYLTGGMIIPRRSFMSRLPNGNILVAGGRSTWGVPSVLSAVEEYQASSGTWVTRPDMPNVRESFALTLMSSGRVLASGGLSLYGILTAADIYVP